MEYSYSRSVQYLYPYLYLYLYPVPVPVRVDYRLYKELPAHMPLPPNGVGGGGLSYAADSLNRHRWARFSIHCATPDEWLAFCAQLERSTHEDERALLQYLQEMAIVEFVIENAKVRALHYLST